MEDEIAILDDADDNSTSSEFEEEEAELNAVYLGFVEDFGDNDEQGDPTKADDECEDEDDEPQSTIGGKPMWIDRITGIEEGFSCQACSEPMVLLAQVYAPLDWIAEAYHRHLYVFCCPRVACWKTTKGKGVSAVFRSQLPKDGIFASAKELSVCTLCGQPAGKTCAKCHAVKYCSQSHQVFHWKNGHKEACGEASSEPKAAFDSLVLLAPKVLVTEEECWAPDKAALEAVADANASLIGNPQTELHSRLLPESADRAKLLESAKKADAVFLRFQVRVKDYPDQVLRYSFGAKRPLWVNSGNQMVGSPPVCESCGSQRVFEFQLMPQLLFFLNIDSKEDTALDWSSLIVYSCEKSCSTNGLAKEYLFVH